MAVMDSYAMSNNDSVLTLYSGSFDGIGQAFTGDGGDVDEVDFELDKTGSPTGNAVAKLYASTGTFGTDMTPTGSALATSGNLDVSTLTGTPTTKTFTFSTPYTTTNGTKYVITCEYTGGDASNNVNVGYDISSGTHAGNYCDRISGSWLAFSSFDTGFEVRTIGGGSVGALLENRINHFRHNLTR